MGITARLVDELNEQINAEFQSAYVYLAMASWFNSHNLPGFAHWMRMQWQEETGHAMKLFDFVHNRAAKVILKPLTEPRHEYSTALDLFEHVREHERWVTQKINTLYESAMQEKDLPLQIMLQWFINEQVEEEAQAEEMVERLRLIGTDGPSIYLLDRQLASRAPQTADAGA